MRISGKVVKVEFLRGGISVIIDPVSGPLEDDPYFFGRPRGTFEILGLADEEGKKYKAGQEVTISIEPVVEVVPAGTPVDLTEGEEDLGPQDVVKGDFGYGVEGTDAEGSGT